MKLSCYGHLVYNDNIACLPNFIALRKVNGPQPFVICAVYERWTTLHEKLKRV
jgi:hypothetical protein